MTTLCLWLLVFDLTVPCVGLTPAITVSLKETSLWHMVSVVGGERAYHCHAAINDIVHRTLTTACDPCRLEPAGICTSDGKCPDWSTVAPWKRGKLLVLAILCHSILRVPPLRLQQYYSWLNQPPQSQPSFHHSGIWDIWHNWMLDIVISLRLWSSWKTSFWGGEGLSRHYPWLSRKGTLVLYCVQLASFFSFCSLFLT